MEARSESPNLPYWFRIISLLGKSSPDERVSLLLVLNKRKGGTGRTQYEDLLKIYEDDFDLETFEVDFAENDKRWECLREAIVRRLGDLPIVKNLLPKKWQSIREALRTGKRKPPVHQHGTVARNLLRIQRDRGRRPVADDRLPAPVGVVAAFSKRPGFVRHSRPAPQLGCGRRVLYPEKRTHQKREVFRKRIFFTSCAAAATKIPTRRRF